ncbi:hypothetical protein [Deinococcus sp. 6GRE01]|nr:hypothetical protein [Deinococcus sp. 6GRE01]
MTETQAAALFLAFWVIAMALLGCAGLNALARYGHDHREDRR